MLNSKNKMIWTDKPKVSYNSLVYIINQYYLKVDEDKDKMQEFGEKIGPRIYESIHFQRERPTKRSLKILDMMKFIAQNLWKFLFEKEADSLETFESDKRRHPHTKEVLTEYVIYDYDPVYLSYSHSNTALIYYYAGILKGIFNYCGFDCDVGAQVVKGGGKEKIKCAYVIKFEYYVLDRDN